MVGLSRVYEVLYIVRPDIEEDEYSEVIGKFEQAVTDEGGEVANIEEWNVRPFAYEIEHYERGYYVLMTFHAEIDVIERLDERFKLDNRILRQQFVRVEAAPAPEADAETSDETAGSAA